jgi:hypothetical protein
LPEPGRIALRLRRGPRQSYAVTPPQHCSLSLEASERATVSLSILTGIDRLWLGSFFYSYSTVEQENPRLPVPVYFIVIFAFFRTLKLASALSEFETLNIAFTNKALIFF